MEKWRRVRIKRAAEEDGTLFVMERNREVPFDIQRIFLVTNVKKGKTRGDHATKKTRLILFPVSGACKVIVDDGKIKEAFEMNNPSEGLLIEPMVWRSMQEFTPDCIMMAVCDRPFDPGNETWDDYQIFLEKVREG
ncbi:MAG: FdtA/QdtA family cupin domain-containing protein [Oscillospiraceae bacterium]|nr:FdtA/QdtA family cupin domain-containing protein [Oscillospiraceae bacterium]